MNQLEKQKTHGKKRSDEWPRVRKEYLKKHPRCYICLGTKKITVHHRLPFHLSPELELDPKNLITLCEGHGTFNCHLLFGHWGNFRTKYNPDVEADAKVWRVRLVAKKMNENL